MEVLPNFSSLTQTYSDGYRLSSSASVRKLILLLIFRPFVLLREKLE